MPQHTASAQCWCRNMQMHGILYSSLPLHSIHLSKIILKVIIVLVLFVYEVVVVREILRFISSQAGLQLFECFFFSYRYTVFSTFYYETDHRKCEMTLGGWHCGLRLFKLGRPLHKGFEPRSLAWLACSIGQSATTYTTVAVTEALSVLFNYERFRQFLLRNKFIIKNDIKSLQIVIWWSSVEFCCSVTKMLGMSQFNYIFENIKGEDNVNDDCLIRSPHKETVNIEEPYSAYTLMFVTKSFEMPVTIVDINKHTDTRTTLFA